LVIARSPFEDEFYFFWIFTTPNLASKKNFATHYQSSPKVYTTLTSFQSGNVRHTEVLTNDIMQGILTSRVSIFRCKCPTTFELCYVIFKISATDRHCFFYEEAAITTDFLTYRKLSDFLLFP